MKKERKNLAGKTILVLGFVALSYLLLRGECIPFMTWYLLAFLLGLVFMPVTAGLFPYFQDKGWMFSKMVGISVTGFLTWLLVSVRFLKFNTISCISVTVCCMLGCIALFYWETRRDLVVFPWKEGNLIFWQECFFFLIFLLWVYLAAFRPETSNSTEKYMDFGFMQALMRSETMPPVDLWYSQGKINYYYGGQYFAVFLSRMTGTSPEITYNISRMLVAAMAASLPCSLVYQLLQDKWKKQKRKVCALAGVLAGLSVGIAGNLHYIVYGVVLPLYQRITGQEISHYWFPDATRYIGHNPDVPTDKTIHEFPCYSFVLGDLHAHVVNIMFVLLLVGLLYAWMQRMEQQKKEIGAYTWKEAIRQGICQPHIWLAGWLLGIYHWTNYWDFVIYFVVTGGVVLFMNIVLYQGEAKRILSVTAVQAIIVVVVSTAVSLPFTLQFETMVTGVALAQHHTKLYQLAVLWGLPAVVVGIFLLHILSRLGRRPFHVWMEEIAPSDFFIFIVGLCGLGLVMMPEVVYVRDIYEGTSARANTMFKLTYQAFILLGISMSYILIRAFAGSKRKLVRIAGALGLCCLLSSFAYFGKAAQSWYGNVFDRSFYQGLNTTAFVEGEYPEDAAAIRWLNQNVEGQPVVLEANGDSYSRYCRVSAMTGLPTILGWYVHEWLWRSDVGDVNEKSADVETIYTSEEKTRVKELLEEYEVSYIFLGSMEREKYGDRLNTELLESLGSIVYRNPGSETCIIQIEK